MQYRRTKDEGFSSSLQFALCAGVITFQELLGSPVHFAGQSHLKYSRKCQHDKFVFRIKCDKICKTPTTI